MFHLPCPGMLLVIDMIVPGIPGMWQGMAFFLFLLYVYPRLLLGGGGGGD